MRIRLALLALVLQGLSAAAVAARPLESGISGLFGGTLSTFIDPRAGRDAQRPEVADRFSDLSAALSSSRSQLPVPSASGSFRYSWNDATDTYRREELALGSAYAERAQALGRGALSIGATYSRISFDTFDDHDLQGIDSTQPAMSASAIQQLPEVDRRRAEDDVLHTRLDVALDFDLFFLTFAYGLTDRVDVSASVTVNRAHLRVRGEAVIEDRDGDGGVFFTVDQRGAITGGEGACTVDFRCAIDDYDDTAVGFGDLYFRSKWHAFESTLADVAVAATVTVPTGGGDDLLGFHGPTLTPLLIVSHQAGRVSPHVNVGYAIRGDDDGREFQWAAGGDVIVVPALSASVDVLGFHDDRGEDVVQSAFGLRANPFADAVVGFTVQVPVNREGLRADWIYTAQLQWLF